MSTYDGKSEFYRTLSSDNVCISISRILEQREFSISTFPTVKFVFHIDTFSLYNNSKFNNLGNSNFFKTKLLDLLTVLQLLKKNF